MFDANRRSLLLGTSGLLLTGLATGLAPGWLRFGIPSARADNSARLPTTLILATSDDGDPMNAYLPGTYVDNVVRPSGTVFSETTVSFGGQNHAAPVLWEQAPASLRDKLSILHHRTEAQAHNEYGVVMGVRGAVKGADGTSTESLPSAIGQEMAGILGSLQDRPICVGPERFNYKGRPLGGLKPSSLATLFSGSEGVLDDLRDLRDASLDAIYADLRVNGTRAQRAMLDQHALSRNQARELGLQLGDLIETLTVPNSEYTAFMEVEDDGPYDQIAAAVALAMLRATPVISIHIPWGGDNHQDVGLPEEIAGAQAGMDVLNSLWSRIDTAGVRDQITFGLLNIFGRTLNRDTGRQHNPGHNGMLIAGPNTIGGVVGGIDDEGDCTSFDPSTGLVGGSVAPSDTFAASAATMMAAVGMDDARIGVRVAGGTLVDAVLLC